MKNSTLRLALGSATVAALSSLVTTDPVRAVGLYDFTSSQILFGGGDLTVGFEFTANSTFTIDSLGYFDANQNGLQDSHDIGIFDTSGTLLTSATVLSGTASSLDGKFRYANISSFTLNAGQTYRIGGSSTSADGYNYGNFSSAPAIVGLSVDPKISISTGVYAYGTGLNNPNSGFLYNMYPMVNMRVVSSGSTSVPEPFTIIGTLVGGTAALRMRKKLKANSKEV
jgi:hypothetical protein